MNQQANLPEPVLLPNPPDINEVAPMSEEDQACLDQIREVLLKHNSLDRFGISLLHKHFDVADNEMLVEVCDPETRTLTTRPMKKSELAGHQMIETNWRLSDSPQAVVVCDRVCLQFTPPGRILPQHYIDHIQSVIIE